MIANETPTAQEQLIRMVTGYWLSQAVYVAAKLGIADLLRDGPRDCDWLAEAAGAHRQSLYRLLRALASVGLFAEDPDGRFRLTPLAELLRGDVPGSQRALALMQGEEHYLAWGRLLHSIRSGECAFEHLHAQGLFDYLAEHPSKAAIFDGAMTSVHGRETTAMLAAYDFSGFGTFVDVGGGNGTTLAAVLAAHPSLRGVLFDLPHVAERARGQLASAGVAERAQVVGGSFFEEVPPGGDAYHLRHIIHDWDDQRSLTILRACRKAMSHESTPKAAKLLIVECVIPPGNGPFAGKFLDLNMMVNPGGQERTEAEYRMLLSEAGFRLSRIVPTSLEISVIEGVCA